MSERFPGVLWIAIVILGLMVLGKVLFAFQLGPLILIDAAVSAALLVGLCLRHKWAYVLTIVFACSGIIFGFEQSLESGLIILVLNCLVLVPVLLSTSYFFPPRLRQEAPARNAENSNDSSVGFDRG